MLIELARALHSKIPIEKEGEKNSGRLKIPQKYGQALIQFCIIIVEKAQHNEWLIGDCVRDSHSSCSSLISK